jgi:hypothetical protein
MSSTLTNSKILVTAYTANGDLADADGEADPAPATTGSDEEKDVPMENGTTEDAGQAADVTMSEAAWRMKNDG